MIPYVEIKDKYTLKTLALVEPQECWFELSYQDVGEFEIYARASKANLNALQKGRYAKIPNKRFIWVITSVQYTFTAGGARMILAKGYEAKWLLSKRCILTPKEISGNITRALYGLVDHALGVGAQEARRISDNNGGNMFYVDYNAVNISVDGTQATRGNLLEFVTSMLKEHDCGHTVTYDSKALKYTIYQGVDKRQLVRFSQSLDNLLQSEYLTDDAEVATYALVVSTVEDVDYTQDSNNGGTGIDRAEIYLESNISTKYEDANGEEKELDLVQNANHKGIYQSWLAAEGYAKLTEHTTREEINGEIDIANTRYAFDVDFFLGDMVKVQDEYFNFSFNPKIQKYTFKQDANGYGEEAEYGGKQ